MTRKFSSAAVLILALALMPGAAAQEAGEKAAPQKAPAEKPAPEKAAPEKSAAEKAAERIAPDWLQPSMKAIELRAGAGSITLRMDGDSRAVYEAIGKQAGIKILVDPDYISRNIRVDINKTSLQDALTVVAAESRTFWRPVTSDTILIAQDSQSKRRELEQSVIKAFYFPNVSTAVDLQDIVNLLRTILEVQRIQQLPSQSTIIVRGSPSQIAMSEKVIDAVEKAKKRYGQYRLEFRISELEREKKLNSRSYTLLVEQHEAEKLRIGTRIPVQVSADASAEKKQIQYMDVGQNIDCQVRTESEHTVGLNVDVDFSNFAMSDQLGGESTAARGPGTPVLQQFRVTAKATLELGKPTIIISFDDPSSKHTFQIEVTATRIRERE